MSVEHVDVLVVGAGLAGLRTATLLAGRGHDVLLVDRRHTLDAAIRTTGIFVRKTLDDFELPAGVLGPAIRRVVLHPPGLRRPVELRSERDEFRVADMGVLYAGLAALASDAGVGLALGTRYLGTAGAAVRLAGPQGERRVRPRFLVGADGARSAVARDLGLDANRALLLGAEDVFAGSGDSAEPTFHCVIDPVLAPGYLAWVVDDGRHVHVGTAGYPHRFPDGVRAALAGVAAAAPGLAGIRRPTQVEHRAGLIPVGGLLRRISSPRGLLVGDAAGAVSPLTAGGLDPCLRQAGHAAHVLDVALRTADPGALAGYDGATLRRRFRGRLALRHGLAAVRSRAVAELGFVALRTAAGRRAAASVLFADRSFPDVAADQPLAPAEGVAPARRPGQR